MLLYELPYRNHPVEQRAVDRLNDQMRCLRLECAGVTPAYPPPDLNPATDYADDVHLNNAGYAKISYSFANAVLSVL